MLLAGRLCVFALDPTLDVSQYAHTAWKIREGFTKGTITSIAQTPDGYLWLGTEFGLLRFDGVRNDLWQPPPDQHLPDSYVRSLLAARDGTLWIGTAKGLTSWKNRRLALYPELAEKAVDSLLEDHEGTVWAGGQAAPTGRLCAIQNGRVRCYGQDGSLGQSVEPLYEDPGSNLWVGGLAGLWRWRPGPPKLYPMPPSENGIQGLLEGESGALLIALGSGIRQLVKGKIEEYPLRAVGPQFRPRQLLRDRNGGLWIGTEDLGLVHKHEGRVDVFGQSDGLSGNFIERLFEDREGNIWVSTLDGLDRFRDFAVTTISVKQGLSNAIVESVLAAWDGSVWLGTVDGLDRWDNGQITIYHKQNAQVMSGGTKRQLDQSEPSALGAARHITDGGLPDDAIESLFQDDLGQIWVSTRRGVAYLKNGRFIPVNEVPGGVHSIAEDRSENVWISQAQNLFRLRGGSVVERIPWTQLGRPDGARALVADPLRGGLWLGFRDGGLGYFQGGQLRETYTVVDGLGEAHLRGLQLDRDGTLWVATEGGLSRVKNGRIATLTSKNGLPCDAIHWVMEDDEHSFWLYMACGLVRIAGPELDAWVATADKDPQRRIHAALFDSSDGVRYHATTTGYSPSAAESADGRIWFLPWDGVGIIDPRRLAFNKLAPQVHIERVVADHRTYDASSKWPLRLPPLIRDLEIDYTGLSFVAPEKVLFRYKLEGRDRDWQDAGTRRQAFYGNLPPRNYRFRVRACNNSGVWNEAGAFLDFSIAPAYYQTNWFRALCAAAVLGLFAAVYQFRVHQLARQFNLTLEARVNERTRIARELHDTLLQSFQGLLLKLQVVSDLLADGPAKQELESAINDAGEAITEGRDAVQDLRSSTLVTNDLAGAISALGQELAANQAGNGSASFRVEVEGTPRDLHPLLRDEVYRIAAEALRNAFRHAKARHIESEILYEERQLRLRVRDDGNGLDPAVVRGEGRPGHFGLHGMRERATLIGARLDVWSKLHSGTEVELTVPASRAYAISRAAGAPREV